ncbi:hypothetical protein, partial [Duganella callida]
MKHKVLHTLAAACLAAVAAPSFANSTASATFGNLVITLTDLDPNDGIAPTLTYGARGPSSIDNFMYTMSDEGGISKQAGKVSSLPTEQLSLETRTKLGWGVSSVTVADTVAGFSAMSAHGVADSIIGEYGTYRSVVAGPQSLSDFTVSANTKVTFSLTSELKTRTTMGFNLDALEGESALAKSSLSLFGQVGNDFQFDGSEHTAYSSYLVNDDNTVTGMSDDWSGVLSVSFINTSAASASAQLQASLYLEGKSASWDGVTPVPEPSQWLALSSGLLLLG